MDLALLMKEQIYLSSPEASFRSSCSICYLYSLSNPDSLWFGYIRNMMDGVNMHSGKCHV